MTTTLSAGSSNSNCPDGGVQIDVGVDDNDNGVLDSDEIDQTTYICNGADGSDGADGQDGADGADGSASPNTMLTSISPPIIGMLCRLNLISLIDLTMEMVVELPKTVFLNMEKYDYYLLHILHEIWYKFRKISELVVLAVTPENIWKF